VTVVDRMIRCRTRAESPAPEPEPLLPNGFEFTKRPSARAARWTRTGWRALLVLSVLLLLTLVVQNVRANNRATSATPAAAVDPDAARVAAATFAADYLSHDPLAAPGAGQAALRRDLAPGGDPARLSFAGTGWLSADVVVPGLVTALDSAHAVVAVEVRVSVGVPASAAAVPAATTAAPAVSGRMADAPALPPSYQITATEWLPLPVPVVQTDTGVLVDVAGPVFSADPAPALTPATESDSSATEATRGWARTLFTSYAASSTSGAYLSAPGVNLAGLAGAVTVTDVTAWSLTMPDPAGLRTGTATVGWTFAPAADLTTSQTYSVTTTSSDTRWYATALGTATRT